MTDRREGGHLLEVLQVNSGAETRLQESELTSWSCALNVDKTRDVMCECNDIRTF